MSENGVNRRAFLKLSGATVALASAGGLLTSIPASAATPAGVGRGWHRLHQVAGFNLQNTQGPALTTSNLIDVTSAKHAPLLRYAGGTTANFWDWRKGWVLDDDQLPPIKPANSVRNKKNYVPWTLEDWKLFCDQTSTQPLYDINILTATLDDQLEMLRYARTLGLPVRYIELGNEFYLDNYSPMVPTASGYAAKASQWATAIKAEFPDAEIAMVGWDRNKIFPTTDRQTTWNAALRPYLESNDALSAITVHPYTFINYIQNQHGEIMDLSQINIRRLLATAADASHDISDVVDNDLPAGTRVWNTEWNIVDLKYYVAASRWIHGVWTAAAAIHLLQVPQLEIALDHALYGAMTFAANHDPAYAENFYNRYGVEMNPWGLTAAGVAIQAVNTAMHGSTHYEPIQFAESQEVTVEVAGVQRTYDDLLGVRLKASEESRGLIVNLSDQSRTVDLLSYGFGPNGRWTQHSADPSQVVANVSTDVTSSEGPVCAHVLLAPYSIAVVSGGHGHRGGRGQGHGGGHGHVGGHTGHH